MNQKGNHTRGLYVKEQIQNAGLGTHHRAMKPRNPKSKQLCGNNIPPWTWRHGCCSWSRRQLSSQYILSNWSPRPWKLWKRWSSYHQPIDLIVSTSLSTLVILYWPAISTQLYDVYFKKTWRASNSIAFCSRDLKSASVYLSTLPECRALSQTSPSPPSYQQLEAWFWQCDWG
jgi:hypothetical protein